PVSVPPAFQDEAWTIVLAAANLADHAAELGEVAAFAAASSAEATDLLRRVPVGTGDAVLIWRPDAGWEAALSTDDARHPLIDLYLPICSATVARPMTVGHL